MSENNRAGVVITVIAAAVGAVGGSVALRGIRHSQTSGRAVAAGMNVPMGQQDRFGRIIEEEMGPLMRDPRFEQELQRRAGPGADQARARAVGAQLTAQGLNRLAPADLDTFTQLRLQLATNSEAVCAGLWSGHTDGAAIAASLARLNDPDLHMWLRLSARAASLELGANGPVQVDQSAIGEALGQISAAATPEDRAAIEAASQAGAAAPPAQGCAAMRAILRGTPQLEPTLRVRFIRALNAG